MSPEVFNKPIPDYGDPIPLESFHRMVKLRGFIDYDGYGYLSDAQHMGILVKPSTFDFDYAKKVGATYVIWFNK